MTVYAIIAPEESPLLAAAVERNFEKKIQFAPGQFVASGTGMTASQVAEKLGANGEIGQFVVFTVAGYWGFHRKDLWEWLAVNSS